MIEIQLGKRKINPLSKPYIIAEIGVNHEGSITLAKKLIKLAKKGGADAAKFQSYKAETLASKNSPSYWDRKKERTKNQFDLFKKYDSFNEKDYKELAKYSKKLKIDFISTPFDHESVDYLDPIVPFFKISSSDITNIPLLEKIAKKKKPILISTGASSFLEIRNALKILQKNGLKKIIIMHCILNYPTKNTNAHLKMIRGLTKLFPKNLIGYSDHTVPDMILSSLLTAFTLGAVVLEKHFTHDKKLKGNDHYHSMDYKNLLAFNKNLNKIYDLIGKKEEKKLIPSENIAKKNARRSLVLKKSINAGEKIRSSHIICKRPATGISPEFWKNVIGQFSTRNMKVDHILKWSDIKKKRKTPSK